jgi:uncharacterized delta-60 repeat protein
MYHVLRVISGRRRRKVTSIVAVTPALAVVLAVGAMTGTGSAAAEGPAASAASAVPATDVAVQPDGKVVVVGASNGNFAVARYTLSGALDLSFSGDGRLTTDFSGTDDSAHAVVVQPDGKIVVVGASNGNFAVARYLPGGALDPTFSTDGKHTTTFGSPDDRALAVVSQPDGKIVLAGQGLDGFAAIRYTTAGATDTGFGHQGRVTFAGSPVTELVLQPDQKILAVGSYVTRLTSLGAIDTTFDTGGLGDGGEGWRRLGRQSDGRIVLGGASDCNTALVARVGPSGAFDQVFNTNAGQPAGVAALGVHVLADNQLMVVSDGWNDGACTAMRGITFERYLANGTRDVAFAAHGAKIVNTDAWPAAARGIPATNVAAAPDGKFLVVGATYVARFTSAGALDRSFSADGIALTGF